MRKPKALVGDIFESKAQTLVNTVNCVGVMGKGLSLEFKKRFPDMFKDYSQRCRRGEIRLGKPHLYKRVVIPWILLFPTKDDWRSLSRMEDIQAGLRYLEQHYRSWGITSLAVPPLGCGLGELDWDVVGPTLYGHLEKLDIPVELYAPWQTPNSQLTPEYLGAPSRAQLMEANAGRRTRIEPGLIVLLEALRALQETRYSWPIGRTAFQKLAYFGTRLGLETGLTYRRGSFGPFAPELKAKLTRLANHRLINEERRGRMFEVKVGPTFKDARERYKDQIGLAREIIERLTDLFSRMNTKQAELASTVDFAYQTMEKPSDREPTEDEVLNEVMEWKRQHRPPYDRSEVARTIRNITIQGWIKVKAGSRVSGEVEPELEV